jgi:tRNA(Ile)-lysidine synthase
VPQPAAVSDVRRMVRRCLADLPAGSTVCVACSGGADSLALLAATAMEAPRAGLSTVVLTVDHGLQAGSAAQAARVAAVADRLGVPADVLPVQVAAGGGPEAAARSARYAALDEAADRHGAAAVLLGHTQDDQAETVLLGLARGSGARSLAGMAERSGRYRRPFLGLPRGTTVAACRALGLEPWADPHNTDPAYARVRVRTDALPALESALGPGVAAALACTAALLRADADALDGWAARVLADATAADGSLDATALGALPAAVRGRVLRSTAVAAGVPAGALTAAHVAEADRLVTAWRGQGPVALPGGYGLVRRCGRLHVLPVAATKGRPVLDDDIESVLISEKEIQAKIEELAAAINADYGDREVLLVGVLKGALMMMADLARALTAPVTIDFMAVSSYGSGTTSSGVVRILKDLDRDISGRDVLVVEDIIDSGLTLSWLLRNLRSRGPASVEVCALLRKPEAATVDVPVKYMGFDIPNEFVVGYGLDYDQRYRNLRYVGTLKPSVYSG